MSDTTASKTPKGPVADDQDATVGTAPAAEPKKTPAKTSQPAETKPKT